MLGEPIKLSTFSEEAILEELKNLNFPHQRGIFVTTQLSMLKYFLIGVFSTMNNRNYFITWDDKALYMVTASTTSNKKFVQIDRDPLTAIGIEKVKEGVLKQITFTLRIGNSKFNLQMHRELKNFPNQEENFQSLVADLAKLDQ